MYTYKFLGAGSFTVSSFKGSSKSFQIINSLDQCKLLSNARSLPSECQIYQLQDFRTNFFQKCFAEA